MVVGGISMFYIATKLLIRSKLKHTKIKHKPNYRGMAMLAGFGGLIAYSWNKESD